MTARSADANVSGMPGNPANSAALSPCRRYRYTLWRTWDPALPKVMFIGLNPSTADVAQRQAMAATAATPPMRTAL